MIIYSCESCQVVLDKDGTPHPEVSEVESDALAEHNPVVYVTCSECEKAKAA